MRHFNLFTHRLSGLWLLFAMVLTGVASQCNTPTPALPVTPDGPILRLGVLTPASGELATFGRTMRNGIIMAFDEWNSQGGVLGHKLEWIVYDTDCTFDTAQRAMRQAIDDGLEFIIGPMCSEAAIGAAVQAEAFNVLMIAPAATHPLVTMDYQGAIRPRVFKVSYGYHWQAQATARFARDTLGVGQAALLSNPGDSYTTALVDAFAQEFKARGGQIVYESTYTPGSTDFTDPLQAIDQTDAEFIYLPAQAAVANQVATRLNELGLTRLTLLGSDAWESEELNLSAAEGSYFPVHFSPENEQTQSWVQIYKSTYATAPNTLAALGYDAANILVNSIEQTGSNEPEIIAKTLEQGEFEGVTGPITFEPNHNPLKPIPFLFIQSNNTRFVISIEP